MWNNFQSSTEIQYDENVAEVNIGSKRFWFG